MDREEVSSGPQRGRLKVFLGAAAGVGKTYAMLGEARDLKAAGVDVVIGYLEAHLRRATEDRAAGLEVAPRRVARVGGRTFADIDVFTTVNIQHLESLNDKIFELTGVRVRETFPDRLLRRADSLVLIDLPPGALRERIAQGRVYATEKIPTALANFFRTENLVALRALALREVAEQQEAGAARGGDGQRPRVAERVLVCIDGRPNSEGLVRRASRIARRVDGRLYLLHVSSDADPLPPEAAATVDRAAGLAADLGATVLRREGQVAPTVVAVATEIGVTQIVLGESHRPRWRELVGQSIIAHVLRETDGIDILIVADARARMENLDAGQDG